jgi:parallel beta-helix repeat protein
MNKSYASVFVLVFLTGSCIIVANPVFSSVDVTSDSWTSKAPMQAARSRLGVAEVNGKIYAIGGDNARLLAYQSIEAGIGEVVNTNEEYNPETDTWVFKAPMPTPRCSFAVAVYENKIYCIGGYINGVNVTGVNQVYDPATNTWETKASMPTPRAALQANVVNGKIYLIGGSSDRNRGLSSRYLGVNEVYDPATDTWTTKTSAPNRITSGASAVAYGKVYFLATVSNLDAGAFIQIYDTTEDSWSTGSFAPTYGELSTTACVTSSVVAPKKIVFFSESSTYVYYPMNDSWAEGTLMPTARGYAGVAAVKYTFYVIGGIKAPFRGLIVVTGSIATNEQYTPNDLQPVKADRIYIKADGSIEPPTANITTDDNIFYNLTSNINEQLVVQRNNVIVDGNGYTIQGTGTSTFGIALFQRQNVIIRNVTVRDFETAAIGMEESTNIIISGNTLQSNLNEAIRSYSSSNNVISGNTITSNQYGNGIYLLNNSDNNMIFGNNMVMDNLASFIIRGSKDNHIYHNNIMEKGRYHSWVEDAYSNIWDDDYPSGGNYWSHYNNTDSDEDGIGDAPYVINENNKDNYPLMAPFNISSVTLKLPDWAYQSPVQEDQTTPEPFPTAIVAASIASLVVISVGLLAYFKKRKTLQNTT